MDVRSEAGTSLVCASLGPFHCAIQALGVHQGRTLNGDWPEPSSELIHRCSSFRFGDVLLRGSGGCHDRSLLTAFGQWVVNNDETGTHGINPFAHLLAVAVAQIRRSCTRNCLPRQLRQPGKQVRRFSPRLRCFSVEYCRYAPSSRRAGARRGVDLDGPRCDAGV